MIIKLIIGLIALIIYYFFIKNKLKKSDDSSWDIAHRIAIGIFVSLLILVQFLGPGPWW